MGSGGPTIIGKRGVEDLGQSRGCIAVGGGRDVGRATPEVLKGLSIGHFLVAKEIEVGRGDHASAVHFRSLWGAVAGNRGL